MHIHIQCADAQTLARLGTTAEAMYDGVSTVGGGSGTQLVIIIYVLDGSGWAAECHHSWFGPEHIHNGTVPGLPARFRLITVAMGMNTYPYESVDDYGWQWRFETFADHLAAVLAHELYHFTQPHFARHRSNDEYDANLTALQQVQRLGFRVEATAPRRGVRYG